MQNLKPLFTITTVLATCAPACAERDLPDQVISATGSSLAREKHRVDEHAVETLTAEDDVPATEGSLVGRERVNTELQAVLADKQALQLLFATGEDSLSDLNRNKLGKLAELLRKNPGFSVSLAGHADVRGSDEYNNVLAIERARSVKRALGELGIAEARMQTFGYGSQFATAAAGDAIGLARDRRVEVEVTVDGKFNDNLARK